MPQKRVCDSAVDFYPYEIFPNDINPHGTVFGGTVLQLIDRISGGIAQRHAGAVCVTLFIDSVRFLAPGRQGETLVFKGAVNRTWNTSMEIGIKVFAENFLTGESRHIVSAYLTFVAVDTEGRPTTIPTVIPETDEEKRRFREASTRREHRLSYKKN